MKIDQNSRLADVATAIAGARAVFEAIGIDYSCSGTQTIAEAAEASGLDTVAVVAALRILPPAPANYSWADSPLSELLQHLRTEHHRFVQGELSRIAFMLAQVSGDNRTVQLLRAAFVRVTATLIPHMADEEHNVFPAIEALENAWLDQGRPMIEAVGLHEHIQRLIAEHAAIAKELRGIRDLRMTLAADVRSAPRFSIAERLTTLEAHLHEYMFLENFVVFPRALALAAQTHDQEVTHD